ncbi:hypothetical protein MtrunA17_Chr6g0468231 [Medicago truncatula]|uniref:Uncharacterized protein n=1 Tax=Medicago truncatula TaxID=3880 RepID=A0A396HDM6_MEDTR|nr:hypothetical protein MtrunA17_Chr6g0468231 [Medicago truncatula]
MASLSSAPRSSSNMQEAAPAYEIKGITMSLEEWELKIQSKSPVDFTSLAHHRCDTLNYYEVQGLVTASIYDREAAKLEEAEKVLLHPELEGKSRSEMGFKPFEGTEIRSSIMGIPVHISEDIIAFVLRRPAKGTYRYGIKNVKTSPWNETVNQSIFNNKEKGVYVNLGMEKKMMLKIQNDNLLPKGRGSDEPSLEHKIFLHLFITGEPTNVPRYIFRHMIQQLRESQLKKICWVPYGRLISEEAFSYLLPALGVAQKEGLALLTQ